MEEIKSEEIKPETSLMVIPEEKVEEKKEEVAEVVKKVCLDCGNPLPEDYPEYEELCGVCKTKKEEDKSKSEIIPEIKVEETKAEAEVKLEEVEKTTPEETKVEAEVKPEIVEEVIKEEAPAEIIAEEAKVETPVEIKTEEVVIVPSFTKEQLDEAVNAAKAEKDFEISKLKEELEKKSQEMVKAKEEEITPASLTVGEVNTTGEDLELKRQKDNVNNFIASKHKK